MKKVTTFTTSLTTAKRNEQRAQWAERALLAFAEAADVSLEYAVGDLIGDLMHWCDHHGQDFKTELRRGYEDYEHGFGR